MIRLEFIYVLMGCLMGGVALVNALDRAHPKRIGNALFWGLYAVSFLLGSHLPDFANGVLVIAMVAVAAARALGGASNDGRVRRAGEIACSSPRC
jgi:uncharacterized membrane protein